MSSKSYRVMLKHISDGLSKRDLSVIKFLCADVISPSELEKVKNGFEIWKVLENRGYLGPDDYRFLAEILYFADRIDLVRKCADERKVSKRVSHGDVLLPPFRVLLCKLGKEIPNNDFEGVKYIFSEELSVSSREDTKDVWTFFLLLENQNLLGPDNVDCLKQIIDVIDRPALLNLIDQYQASLNSKEGMPNYRQHDRYCNFEQEQTASWKRLGLKNVSYEYSGTVTSQSLPRNVDDLVNAHIYLPPNQNSNPHSSQKDAGDVLTKDNTMLKLYPGAHEQEQCDSVKELHSDAEHAEKLYIKDLNAAEHSNKEKNQVCSDPTEPDQELTRCVRKSLINQEPSIQELPAYPMNAVPRGPCIIINNQVFKPNIQCKKNLEDRPGSSIDEVNLGNLFEYLGFAVHHYNDCTVNKMKQIFEDLAKKDGVMRKADALVVIILSHGKYGAIYGADSKELKIIKILEYFQSDKCPGLVNKPKMFFFQACQGKGKQKIPVKVHADQATEVEDDNMPQDADFFIGYATIPGYVSYRHEDNGSWYISSLVENLRKYCQTYDLLSIMTEVNRCVARRAVVESEYTYKQLPLPYTTLTKKVYLRPVNYQKSAAKKA